MTDVVVLNHDDGVLDALGTVIESAGFGVVTRLAQEPVIQLAAFIRRHDPRVVVYDLGPPPPEAAVQKWRELCQQPGAERRYVLTTSYPCDLDPHPCMVECVLLEPLELADLVAALHRAIRR